MAFYTKEVTAKHKKDFLDNYLNYGSVEHTLKAIGLSSTNTVRKWKINDPVFLAQYLEVQEKKVDILEGLAFQIARGDMKVNVPQCTMIIFQLKALKPEVYTDKAQYEVIVKSSQQKALERVERLAGLYNKPKIDNVNSNKDEVYIIQNRECVTTLGDSISAQGGAIKKDMPLLGGNMSGNTEGPLTDPGNRS